MTEDDDDRAGNPVLDEEAGREIVRRLFGGESPPPEADEHAAQPADLIVASEGGNPTIPDPDAELRELARRVFPA